MTARLIALVVLLGAASVSADTAKDAPTACVNREKQEWRQVRNAHVDGQTLQYCTGDDCWSYDLVKKKVTAIAKLPVTKPPPTTAGSFSDASGAHATATETHAEFCVAASSCKAFDYKLPDPPINGVYPEMNADHTLGAIVYRPETEAGKKSTVITFDLTAGKQIKQITAGDVNVLPHGFLIGDTALYDAKMKSIGKLAVADGGYEQIGTSDVFALHDKKKGAVVLQDVSTAKILGRIDLGATDPTEWWTFAVSPDGGRLYAIGSAQDEGKIIVIGVANHELLERTTPPPCAAGTHRVN
jgi:hypothetical protein